MASLDPTEIKGITVNPVKCLNCKLTVMGKSGIEVPLCECRLPKPPER